MNSKIEYALAAAGTAFAEVDTAPTIAELERIGQYSKELAAAVERANGELQDAADAARRQSGGPDPHAAGEALLRGDDVLAAAPDLAVLEKRRAALAAGLRELRARQNALAGQRDRARSDIEGKLADAVAPIVEELANEARMLGAKLVQLYASVAAIEGATGNREAHRVGENLRHSVAELIAARIVEPGPLEPDPRVLATLEQAAPAIELARRGIQSNIRMPDVRLSIGMMAAMSR